MHDRAFEPFQKENGSSRTGIDCEGSFLQTIKAANRRLLSITVGFCIVNFYIVSFCAVGFFKVFYAVGFCAVSFCTVSNGICPVSFCAPLSVRKSDNIENDADVLGKFDLFGCELGGVVCVHCQHACGGDHAL